MTYRAENPRVNEVLASWNRTGDYEYLQSYFVERVLEIVSRLGNKAAIGKGFNPMFFFAEISNAYWFSVWQEVFDNGDQIDDDTLVQVWKGWGRGWRPELADVSLHFFFKITLYRLKDHNFSAWH